MGEGKRSLQTKSDLSEPMIVDTLGGRVFVKWDLEASATPAAQLTFFAEFLQTTGLWDAWVSSCPIRCTSPNAPLLVDVLGTWFLAILSGHKRYSHITALRGDKVSAQLLGMSKIIGEDALRRALLRTSPGRPSHQKHFFATIGGQSMLLTVQVRQGEVRCDQVAQAVGALMRANTKHPCIG